MDIYWDLQNHKLYGANNASQLLTAWTVVYRDDLPVNLYLCRPASSGDTDFTVEAPAANKSVRFGVRVTADLIEGDLLVAQTTWAFTGEGEASVAAANIYFAGSALAVALTAATLACTAEFTLRDSGTGRDADSTQIPLTIQYDVNRVEDAELEQAIPLYNFFTDSAGKQCLRILNQLGETLETMVPPGGTGIPS